LPALPSSLWNGSKRIATKVGRTAGAIGSAKGVKLGRERAFEIDHFGHVVFDEGLQVATGSPRCRQFLDSLSAEKKRTKASGSRPGFSTISSPLIDLSPDRH
jgi:hypothetical protein